MMDRDIEARAAMYDRLAELLQVLTRLVVLITPAIEVELNEARDRRARGTRR